MQPFASTSVPLTGIERWLTEQHKISRQSLKPDTKIERLFLLDLMTKFFQVTGS